MLTKLKNTIVVIRKVLDTKAIFAKGSSILESRSSSVNTNTFPNLEYTNSKLRMSLAQLEQEKAQLEEKVRDLVQQLEDKKHPEEIRLKKDQVIKSKEDELQAMKDLEIKDHDTPATATSQGDTKAPEQQAAKKQPAPRQKKAPAAAAEPEKPIDVSRLDLRIGKIIDVDRHPDADSLYVEKIDCGDASGPRTVISGLVKHVPIEEMRDRLVVVLCNLKPAKMRGILSEAMVMCASTPDKVELLQPPADSKPGDRVVFADYVGEPDAQLNPKKKIWEQVAPDIKTNDDGIAMYKGCEFSLANNAGKFKSNLANVNIR